MPGISTTAIGNQENSRSPSPFGTPKGSDLFPDGPKSHIHVETDPQEQKLLSRADTESIWKEEDSSKTHSRPGGPCQVIHSVLALVVFGLSAVLIYLVTGGFTFISRDMASRDYQIQTLDHFAFGNIRGQNSGLPSGFSGVMHVLSGPSDQGVDLNVSIRSFTSDLHGGKPGAEWRPSRLRSRAEVTLFFRPGLQISDLHIKSNTLQLVLSSDITVMQKTTISLKKGRIVAEKFDSSRETYIDVRKTSVDGTFGLRDVLSIKAQSGSVSIKVNPKQSLEGRPKPAVFKVESRSGAVNIDYPGDKTNIPDREYQSSVTSRSGAVRATLLHGKETTIVIRSGSMDAKILPYGAGRGLSSLSTRMESGASKIEVLPPPGRGQNPLRKMSSSHSARSGNLQLKYPDEWQGGIHGEARSGSISLKGQDIELLDQNTRGGKKWIHARKGRGWSKLKFEVRSGNVDAVIGN